MNTKIYITIFSLLLGHLVLSAQNSSSKLNELNNYIDHSIDIRTSQVRIGISSSNNKVATAYVQSVMQSGGVPIIIPTITDINSLRSIVTDLDGLILSGGEDFSPEYYNEKPSDKLGEVDTKRDTSDLALIKLATDRNIPILGICRGEQGINVAFGGKLIQDIPSQISSTINHNQTERADTATHQVKIVKESKLAKILGTDSILVNSLHHQAVKDVAPGFRVAAYSEDGIIEAIEAYPHRKILAVQWHPERLAEAGDTNMAKLFAHLISEAKIYNKAKRLHQRILTIDSHTDTPLAFKQKGYNLAKRDTNYVNLPKMQEGMLDAVFMAAYTAQGARDQKSSKKAVIYITNMVSQIHQQAELHPDLCGIAMNRDDITRLKSEGKKAILIGVENGYAIGKDIKNLQKYYDMGGRYMTLCHTKDNDICDTSSQTENEWGGLSPFGEKVVKEMNKLGMLIDISHASINTFYDVLKISNKPIIATHSSVRSLCEHDRNLTDDQIKAIAKNNGVVQVCMVDLFINPETQKASLEDAIDHIDYIVDLVGIDYVGIGTDFDGGGRLIGLEGANDLLNITIKLIERGYTDEDIEKIWGGNLLRVLEEAI